MSTTTSLFSVTPLLVVGVLGALLVLVGNFWLERRPGRDVTASPRPLLNEAERDMFVRLSAAMPDGVVLAKVSLAALVSVPFNERARIRHRHVDFVLCDRSLGVLGVVQLVQDEELQNFRVGESAQALLEAAGYTVFAWDTPPADDVLAAAMRVLRQAGPRALRTDAYAPKASVD